MEKTTIEWNIQKLLRTPSSGYTLDLFSKKEIEALEIYEKDGKPYIKCYVTGKDRLAKPEEIVRQLYLRKLIHDYSYPKDRIAVEKGVYFGSQMAEKRADIVIFDPKSVIDTATFEDPNQFPIGIEYVFVNGVLVAEHNKHTGAFPGRVLYRS